MINVITVYKVIVDNKKTHTVMTMEDMDAVSHPSRGG